MSYHSPSKSLKNPIFVQYLLGPKRLSQHADRDPPSYAATQKDTPEPMPMPELIDELFRVSQSALGKIGKTKPGQKYNTELTIQRNAFWWDGNISVFELEYSKVQYGGSAKEIMKHGGCKYLYAGMFRCLAEAIFHAYKVVRSVKDATNFKTSSDSTLWAWQRIQQDDALFAEIRHGMDLIRSYAPIFGFSFEGYDLWIQRKSEEDYSVLFQDERYKNKLFVAMDQAINADSERWGKKMGDMDREFTSLRLRAQRSGPQKDELPAYSEERQTKEGYEVKERYYA